MPVMPSQKPVITVRPTWPLHAKIVAAAAEAGQTPSQFLLHHGRKAVEAAAARPAARRAPSPQIRVAPSPPIVGQKIPEDWYGDATDAEREQLNSRNHFLGLVNLPALDIHEWRAEEAKPPEPLDDEE